MIAKLRSRNACVTPGSADVEAVVAGWRGDVARSEFRRFGNRVSPITSGRGFRIHFSRDCSGSRSRVVNGCSGSGCEGSVRDRAVLRAAGGGGGGAGADDRAVAGADRRAGCADRGAGAAAGRLVAELVEAAVGRWVGQAGAEVTARAVRAQAR